MVRITLDSKHSSVIMKYKYASCINIVTLFSLRLVYIYKFVSYCVERDRKIHEGDLAKQKKRYCRDIRQLRKDITNKREELEVAVYGDKQFLRNAFQEHRRLQLTYMNSQADVS